MSSGRLDVKVLSARNIKRAQNDGTEKLYFVAQLGDKHFESPAAIDDGAVSKWDIPFSFNVQNETRLKFNFKSRSDHSSDWPIGSAEISLAKVFSEGKDDSTIAVTTTQTGIVQGILHIITFFYPAERIEGNTQPSLFLNKKIGVGSLEQASWFKIPSLMPSEISDTIPSEIDKSRQLPQYMPPTGSTGYVTTPDQWESPHLRFPLKYCDRPVEVGLDETHPVTEQLQQQYSSLSLNSSFNDPSLGNLTGQRPSNRPQFQMTHTPVEQKPADKLSQAPPGYPTGERPNNRPQFQMTHTPVEQKPAEEKTQAPPGYPTGERPSNRPQFQMTHTPVEQKPADELSPAPPGYPTGQRPNDRPQFQITHTPAEQKPADELSQAPPGYPTGQQSDVQSQFQMTYTSGQQQHANKLPQAPPGYPTGYRPSAQ